MKTKLLSALAISVLALSAVAANAATEVNKTAAPAKAATHAKAAPTAAQCTEAKSVKEKHDLGCKLTKAEKKEMKTAAAAAKKDQPKAK